MLALKNLITNLAYIIYFFSNVRYVANGTLSLIFCMALKWIINYCQFFFIYYNQLHCCLKLPKYYRNTSSFILYSFKLYSLPYQAAKSGRSYIAMP